MQVGRAVASTQLGMSSSAWDTSTEIEAHLEYCYKIKEAIEHKGYLSGAQAYILFWDLKESCGPNIPLVVKQHPETAKLADRERKEERRMPADLDDMTIRARAIMTYELDARFFTAERPSNVHGATPTPPPLLHSLLPLRTYPPPLTIPRPFR